MSLIPFASLKLVRCPRSLAPTLVTLPSMSLVPFAPFLMFFAGSGVVQFTDAAGEFLSPLVAGWNKNHLRTSRRRHALGDFPSAKK